MTPALAIASVDRTRDRHGSFAMFLVGFIVTYGITAILVEAALGVIGFAKAPYLNAASYLFALAFLMVGIALNSVSPRLVLPHPLLLSVLLLTFAAACMGISNGNPYPYIVAWTFYIAVGALSFQFFRNLREPEDPAAVVAALYRPAAAAAILLFAFLSVFGKENNYQYVLFEVIALYALLIRPSLAEKAMGALLYAMIHLGSNDGFVQVEINRASILATGAVGVIFMVYKRYLVTLFFGAFVAVAAIGYALSLDIETVETLPRNIKEAILLMQGDDIQNHVSSFQRVYEGQKVMEDYREASDTEWLLGRGLGRTVDMTGAADKTPGQHALLGATEVHNIHFLHYAVFHKFGLAGLGVLSALVVSVLAMLAGDLRSGRITDASFFLYLYLVYDLVFAVPASNFLIANPLWPAFFGYLCMSRRRFACCGERTRRRE